MAACEEGSAFTSLWVWRGNPFWFMWWARGFLRTPQEATLSFSLSREWPRITKHPLCRCLQRPCLYLAHGHSVLPWAHGWSASLIPHLVHQCLRHCDGALAPSHLKGPQALQRRVPLPWPLMHCTDTLVFKSRKLNLKSRLTPDQPCRPNTIVCGPELFVSHSFAISGLEKRSGSRRAGPCLECQVCHRYMCLGHRWPSPLVD